MLTGFAEEAFVMRKLFERGFHVSIPFAGSSPYDLIAEKNGKLIKIQVKLIGERADRSAHVISFRRAGNKPYDVTEFDYLVAVHIKRDKTYIIPIADCVKRTKTTVYYGEADGPVEKYFEAWDQLVN